MDANQQIDNQTGLESDENYKHTPGHFYHGFINEIKAHPSSEKPLFFVRLGLISGTEKNGEGDRQNFIQNVELLVSQNLNKWAALLAKNGLPKGYSGLMHQIEVKGLQYTPVIVDGKPYLNTRGFLESIKLGAGF